MKKNKLMIAAVLVLSGALALSGCGSAATSSSAKSTSSASDSSSSSSNGFEEVPIGDDQQVGPLNVGTVFFQPVDMEPAGMGLKAADANMHLEADIHALANNELGYGKGEFVPDLTVNYTITDESDASNTQSGTFMEMNASDGPHYGANIMLKKAGTYKLTYKIESPESKGWMLHVDPETGVKGRFWTTPLTVSWNWDYTPHEW
ncbi:iron transporter [Bifidobacterium aquikefiri]|uniref:Amino acid ABC transporter substrate-binding protein n=1 Tax=Bifidobacterium aquikefiri TaxID=1653207 RepID=A0A261GAJ4_9BIFI|nr:iron transporter [Bifidobacterium aquikefiri]OZG68434.1 amino acid ABC transporter substrate-binding protein [Bifidobacterium aquikefiri]